MRSIVADYDNKPILDFLRANGHNIQLFYDTLVYFFRVAWLINVIMTNCFFHCVIHFSLPLFYTI